MREGGKGRRSVVIDTDIFIDNLRGVAQSLQWFNRIKNSGSFEVCYSAMTEAELLSGKDCEDKEKEGKALTLLSVGEKVLVTNEIARLGGAVRRRYGLQIGDAIIAATAIEKRALLYTRNISDYSRIPHLNLNEPYKV